MYDGKTFHTVSNSSSGDVSAETSFRYRQDGELVWATYEGGTVRFGTLVAKADVEGCLDMRYQHLTVDGELKTGRCTSMPEQLDDGRLRLHETWQWTSGNGDSGNSVVEEVLSA
jgi:hypothetical protein